uniref:Uncharacterized protein n=1 Tax=Plectus sambesii TaxID=2011161 RepID=A0A914VTF8_9BILA
MSTKALEAPADDIDMGRASGALTSATYYGRCDEPGIRRRRCGQFCRRRRQRRRRRALSIVGRSVGGRRPRRARSLTPSAPFCSLLVDGRSKTD